MRRSGFQKEFKDAVGFGWGSAAPPLDWKTLIAKKVLTATSVLLMWYGFPFFLLQLPPFSVAKTDLHFFNATLTRRRKCSV